MEKRTHADVLKQAYDLASQVPRDDAGAVHLDEVQECLTVLLDRAQSSKGVLTVLVTLLTHKVTDPKQDIRCHQAGMPGGFAGRGIDQTYVTPFMKSVSFPAMAESGWLTRSLEQPEPYTPDYKGKITPAGVKTAFLRLIDLVERGEAAAETVLTRLFMGLIQQRDAQKIDLAKPHSLSISAIIQLLERHFSAKYAASGASRLPSLAIYAAYQCMTTQLARYHGKELMPLAKHNSADMQSGRIGDVDVNNADGSAFEGVEIKHGIVLAPGHIADAYAKLKNHRTERYYLLTTADMASADWAGINAQIKKIADIHGCQVIVNGVYDTLRYYLRLPADTAEFVSAYVDLLKADETLKFVHKTGRNDAVSGEIQ